MTSLGLLDKFLSTLAVTCDYYVLFLAWGDIEKVSGHDTLLGKGLHLFHSVSQSYATVSDIGLPTQVSIDVSKI